MASALTGGLLVVAGPLLAIAKEVKIPPAKPSVTFDVPDDWTITPTGSILQLVSPDKTSIVIVGVVARSKTDITSWQAQATRSMMAFGITFDPNAKVTPPKATPSIASSHQAAGAATAFSGAPSVAPPNRAPAVKLADAYREAPAGVSPEQLFSALPETHPKLPFKVAKIFGTTLNGKPVDVQLINFGVSERVAFLMQQESGDGDKRIVDIVNSVRSAN